MHCLLDLQRYREDATWRHRSDAAAGWTPNSDLCFDAAAAEWLQSSGLDFGDDCLYYFDAAADGALNSVLCFDDCLYCFDAAAAG